MSSTGIRAASSILLRRNIALQSRAKSSSSIRALTSLQALAPSPKAETTAQLSTSTSRFISCTPSLQDDQTAKLEYSAIPKSYHGDYQEYSVIFTNRSLNSMSAPFQQVMRDLNNLLKMTYNAHKVAIMPG